MRASTVTTITVGRMANMFTWILALIGGALIMIGDSGWACFLCLRP
jgi:hypothetical protein